MTPNRVFPMRTASTTRDAANSVNMRGHLGWDNATTVANVKAMCAALRAGDRLSVSEHLTGVESDYTGFRAEVQLFVGPENCSPPVDRPDWQEPLSYSL